VSGDRHGLAVEHQVREDRARHTAAHLGGEIGGRVPPRQAAEGRVDGGHDRVEVSTRHRPDHQDDRVKAGGGRGGVLGEL